MPGKFIFFTEKILKQLEKEKKAKYNWKKIK